MEPKDWIILFVPIIFNGFLLFIFQEKYKLRLARRESQRIEQNKIWEQFYTKLQKFYIAILNFRRLETNPGEKEVSFAEVWNPAATQMLELAELYIAFPSVFKKRKMSFPQLVDKWRYVNMVLQESKTNNQGRISEECANIFCDEHNKMLALTEKCLVEVQKIVGKN